MKKKFAYLTATLLLIGLLVSEFALSPGSAEAIPRSIASANHASPPLPPWRGPEAVEHLKRHGLYDSLAQAMATVDPLVVPQGKLTASDGIISDEFGNAVAISGNTAVIGGSPANGGPHNQGLAYIFVRSGRSWFRQASLAALDGAAADQFGASVAISGETVVIGAPHSNRSRGAAYVFVRKDETWNQQSKLTSSNSRPDDRFGSSVAISGDTVVVGASDHQGSQGAVYVFGRKGEEWKEQQKLMASAGMASGKFGVSVAINGDTLMVGVQNDSNGVELYQGAVYVFTRNAGIWSEQQRLTALDGAPYDDFGHSIAISGETLVVGAPHSNRLRGAVYVFARNGDTWTEQQKLMADDGVSNDVFGTSVATSGDLLVIGAPGDDRVKGSVYIFRHDGASWVQQQQLTASDGAVEDALGFSVAISGDAVVAGAPWGNIDPNANQGAAYAFAISGHPAQRQKVTDPAHIEGNQFGTSVAISGELMVIGVPVHYIFTSGTHRGSAYVSLRDGAIWGQPQRLTVSAHVPSVWFGNSVAISGDTVVVGDLNADNTKGAVYVFVRRGSTWGEPWRLTASDGNVSDNFGRSVAISGDTLAVGASGAWVGTNYDQGAVYVFARDGATWSQRSKLTASDGATNDSFGYSVAIDGETLVVGAPDDDRHQGAAYIYVRDGETWGESQRLTEMDRQVSGRFGRSVAISGDTLVVGAPGDNVGPNNHQGAAYVFVRDSATWSQRSKLTASDGSPHYFFGETVAISGDTLMVGAPYAAIGGSYDQGATYVFGRNGATWSQQRLIPSEASHDDYFGLSVAISSDTMIVGALCRETGAEFGNGAAFVFAYNSCQTTELDPMALPDARAGSSYNQTLTADGAVSHQFSLFSGLLPMGLTLSSGGALSGVPVTAGDYGFTITAIDANLCPVNRNYTLTVGPGCQTITINPTLPTGSFGKSYRHKFTVTGGTAPYRFRISNGALPPGLNLLPDGTLSGVPTGFGSFNFIVEATDATGCPGTQNYTLVIKPAFN